MADFFLDGKKRSERVWTAAEAKAVPMIFTAEDGAAFGFSTPAGLENWLAKNGLAREYSKAQALLNRAPRTLSRQQEAEASAQQAKRFEQYAGELTETLRAAGISPDDGAAVFRYLMNYDPHTGPRIHSTLLYEHIDTKGKWRYIPKGWACPNFNWINFNDICSSVAVFMGGILLWEHAWYKGRSIGLFGYPGYVRNIHTYPFYFNDTASSAITW